MPVDFKKVVINQLEETAKQNGWDNWNEVLYYSENRRTIGQIIEEALSELNFKNEQNDE